jgi:aminopeptidase N
VLYAEKDRGDGLMRNLLSSMRDTAEREAEQGPIYLGYRLGHIEGQSRVFRSVVYNKSAVVLHMLRGLIGDEAFFGGLRRFYAEWRFRKAGTGDLRDAFQAGTPIPLERFFERWILGATLPRIRVTSEIAGDRTSAILRIRQFGEVFDLPLPITVQYAEGPDEVFVVPVTANAIDYPITGDRVIRRITVDDSLIPGDIRG